MAESRNEKTSQNTGFARFGGILSGFDRIGGEPAGARTQDPNIKSVVLYLLSYGFSRAKRELLPDYGGANVGNIFVFPK